MGARMVFRAWVAAAASVLVAGCAAEGQPVCTGEPTEVIGTADGPEDIVPVQLDDDSHRLFVRVRNGIQTVALTADGLRSRAPVPPDIVFDSLGLSYLEGKGGHPGQLFAIDQGAHAVRRFAVDEGRLEPLGAVIAGPTYLPRPNDLLAVPREGSSDPDIYVSNPDLFWTRLREGAWPSVVLLRAGKTPKPVVEDLGFANGIVADQTGDHLLVADYRAKRLVAYHRDKVDGDLTALCHVPLPASPDNLSLDLHDPDRVLVAAQDSLWWSGLHLLVSAKFPSPSRVLEVRFSGLVLQGTGTDSPCGIRKDPGQSWPPLVWADGGKHVAAGSTAVQVGQQLMIGQIVRPSIYSFRCSRAAASPKG